MTSAGTYTVAPFGGVEWAPCGPTEADPCLDSSVDDDLRFTFTVPDGWAAAPFGNDIWLASENNSGPAGAGFLIGRGGWVYSDPCDPPQDPDVPVGPTVDDFVGALTSHAAIEITDPVDATIGGYPAVYLEIQGPDDVTACPYFQVWTPTHYAQGASNLWRIWVLDVDGTRLVLQASEFPETTPERREELQAIVDSLQIERDPASAPSPSPQASPSVADTASVVNGWPGARANPAGFYSWVPGGLSWMHGGGVEISIAELPDDAAGIPVEDITSFGDGLEGPFSARPQLVADARFQSWIMDALGTKVVIVIKSFADTAPSRVAEAEAVVESIDVEPTDTDAGYRLVFELQDGWDSG
jgi:hypothetical protein